MARQPGDRVVLIAEVVDAGLDEDDPAADRLGVLGRQRALLGVQRRCQRQDEDEAEHVRHHQQSKSHLLILSGRSPIYACRNGSQTDPQRR